MTKDKIIEVLKKHLYVGLLGNINLDKEIESIASDLQESGERKTAEAIVEENFKGLDSLINDKDILDFYKRLIVNCILEYKSVPEMSDVYKFSNRLDQIFEQGNPTKAQIIDAFNKFSGWLVPEISDEEIEEYLTLKKPCAIEGETQAYFYFGDIANEAIKQFMRFYKSELAKRMNNEVTMHDLKVDDDAREERKMYDCICKVCKGKFKSSVADMDICPSCYV